jgi:hypothetical protein
MAAPKAHEWLIVVGKRKSPARGPSPQSNDPSHPHPQLIEAAGSHFVSVHFVKADGEMRQLTFNPRHIGEIKGTGHALKDPAAIENIVRCMDIAKGWRSFDCRRVVKMVVNGETVEFDLIQ